MKIENNNLNPVTPQSMPEGVRAAGKGKSAEHASAHNAAEISEKARLLAKARLEGSQMPDERAERVKALKEQVEKGSYDIPYQDLARRLLPVVIATKE